MQTFLLARVKGALGLRDIDLARLIGKSRPTVQAYIGGRLAEQIGPAEARILRAAVRARQVELAKLAGELDDLSR